MTQQYAFGTANQRYKKKLFVDTGFEFMEVNARLIEPYSPPSPQPSLREIKIINAPSHIHHSGFSSYQCSLTLLFPDKESYNQYLSYAGWTHKFYDEKGSIFLGSAESITPHVLEAGRRYSVTVDLILIKKDSIERESRFQFQDIEGHWAQKNIEEMADLGLITVITRDGKPVIYFRPNDFVTRAEFIAFLNRTRRLVERMIRE
ncbi:S-layer homology domain-containing protein [Brevibacillus sp. Leaf182]|uniref:S-layer homology domain-containing protein n=1 Tax=Brevibacillus sp. Leaf182 TaxID=1736290 RepID=UPI0006F56301|nr:S-layer homology domain-containing protein [Brevibacillus sp. Leaf182]RAT97917.1 S-layer homology domain-containing protein [Brevibacillus sp. Leaf182]